MSDDEDDAEIDRWIAAAIAVAVDAALEEAAVIADSFGGPGWGIATAIRAAKAVEL